MEKRFVINQRVKRSPLVYQTDNYIFLAKWNKSQ